MFKWILGTTLIFGLWGYYLANSSYIPISKQIDMKTMQIHKPVYIYKTWSNCSWTCKNYSSRSSYWGSSYGWK